MKELDFDELDKAVSSLMGGITKTGPVESSDEKTLTIDPSLADGEVPTFDVINKPAVTHDDTSEKVTEGPVSSSTPLASRRGGRFMDVVRPSSDMRNHSSPKGVSRQGISIEPRSSGSSTITSKVSDSEDEPVVDKVPASNFHENQPSTPLLETSEEALISEHAWPDPLELSTSSETSLSDDTPTVWEQETTNEEPVEDDTQSSKVATDDDSTVSDESSSLSQVALTPMTSPFISDAKVEKRPLGGNNPPQSDQAEEPDHSPVLGVMAQDSEISDDASAQLPAQPEDVEKPLPEELRSELMAIESDSHSFEHEEAVTPVTPAALPQSTPEPPKQPEVPTGPSSIPQQYKEEPSTGDQTSGSIFDTDSYHQPLAHPAKKKSGWLWVIAIIVILILGAAGGAALYFLGIF